MVKGIFSIGFLALAVLTYPFFISPILIKTDNIKAEIGEIKNDIEFIKRFEEKREDLRKRFNSFTQEDIKTIERILPDERDIEQYIFDLMRLAKEQGLTVTGSIGVSEKGVKSEEKKGSSTGAPGAAQDVSSGTTGPQTPTLLEVTLALSGTYQQLLDYLARVAESLDLSDVESISFSSAPREGGFNFNVIIRSYQLKEAQQP